MREYKNFDEIERDLRLLKLQQEIDKEKIILSYNQTKKSLSPMSILKSAGGAFLKSTLILKGTTKILDFIGSKLPR